MFDTKAMFVVMCFLAAVGSLTVLQGCGSDSGSSVYTCAAACADNVTAIARSNKVEIVSPASQSRCDEIEADISRDGYSNPVCGNELVYTPRSGGCASAR